MVMEFAIVDIETTGGHPKESGITEIAVLVHDGKEVLQTFHSLINPERFIPGFITGLTGIDQEMVEGAPTFGDLAEELFELLKDRVFVAHNVNFDFSFIKEALQIHGYTFNPPRLCTVKLSRKAFPGLPSYSLGRICEWLDIGISQRHRAFGDAEATARLFAMIYDQDEDIILSALNKNKGDSFLPPNLSKEKYQQLPESTGVYYFHDAKGQVIYVGKALNIKSRFKGHFTGVKKNKEKLQLFTEIHDVSWEETGSEFFACLYELMEIKRLWPKFNKAAKFNAMSWAIYHYEDALGYCRFKVSKVSKGIQPLQTFENHGEAFHFLKASTLKFELCPKLAGIQTVSNSCYDHDMGKCKGACCQKESPESYNARALEFIQTLEKEKGSIIIFQEGRKREEKLALHFENGYFSGYGFLSLEESWDSDHTILDSLTKVKILPDSKFLLKAFLPKIPYSQIKVLETKLV